MRLGRTLATAWENMRQRKLRTSLTTLGVVIAVTTIVALASLGEGFRLDIRERLQQGFELDVLIVFPGSFTAGLSQGFTQEDVNSIRSVQNVTLVTPLITLPTAELYSENNTKLSAFTVGGVNFTEMQQMLPERFRTLRGGFTSQGDNRSIVLGYKASTRNDSTLADVGENVTLRIMGRNGLPLYNETFKVIGVLEKGGTPGITNFDYWAFTSSDTALELPTIRERAEKFQILLVKVADPQFSEQVARDVESKFSQYSITVFVPTSLMRQVDNVLNLIQVFLLAIASISLLVAGVSIMNIMTVSVVERTREIGILKAVGAKSRTVLGMFLAEALLTGVVGGIAGAPAGYGISHALALVLSNLIQSGQQSGIGESPEAPQRLSVTPIFSPEWTVIAIVFSIVVCVVFALYPARKASRLNPVDALRYE